MVLLFPDGGASRRIVLRNDQPDAPSSYRSQWEGRRRGREGDLVSHYL